MKKFLAIIALVTFSLSLSAWPEGCQIMSARRDVGTCSLLPLVFSFDDETVLPEGLRENLSSFVPYVLSLHNSSEEAVGIRRMKRELLRKLDLIDIFYYHPEISASKQKTDKMNRAWWGASFVSGSSLISWYGTIAIGALASTNPITGCLWGVGAGCAIVSLFIGKKYRLEQGELLKSKNEFLKEQISDLSEGLVLQFLQDVSEIEPGQEVHFFILLPREGLEELQRQLDGILFRHGFAQGLVVLSV